MTGMEKVVVFWWLTFQVGFGSGLDGLGWLGDVLCWCGGRR